MLDFRHETFLALCAIGSFTKTAAYLHITQPAVSQHIKHLETYYGTRLFEYKGKNLELTDSGRRLRQFALTVSADSSHLQQMLQRQEGAAAELNFGATMTVGEYVCPRILPSVLRALGGVRVNLRVENTRALLQRLCDGEISFALCEGFFDKSSYAFRLFSKERFICVCSPKSRLAGKRVQLEALFTERLIMREPGSGTRDIFEQLLRECSHGMGEFEAVCIVGNISAIKQLVADNCGISFMYYAAAEDAIKEGRLCELSVEGLDTWREFNFVYLKDSLHEEEYMEWLNQFKSAWKC